MFFLLCGSVIHYEAAVSKFKLDSVRLKNYCLLRWGYIIAECRCRFLRPTAKQKYILLARIQVTLLGTPYSCSLTGGTGSIALRTRSCDTIMSVWIKISEVCFQHKTLLNAKSSPTLHLIKWQLYAIVVLYVLHRKHLQWKHMWVFFRGAFVCNVNVIHRSWKWLPHIAATHRRHYRDGSWQFFWSSACTYRF